MVFSAYFSLYWIIYPHTSPIILLINKNFFFRFDSTSSVNEGLKIMFDRCSWLQDKNVSNFAPFVCRRIEWVSSILICQFYQEKRYKYIIKQNLPKIFAFLAFLCAKRFYKVTNILKISSSTNGYQKFENINFFKLNAVLSLQILGKCMLQVTFVREADEYGCSLIREKPKTARTLVK